ncbi:hypothetical protein ABEV74_03335 [Paenibacillus cisolokensis]|uniref:hypothetical protein n=1 Tax=Paenibacillus cisolokensis TaxID=1658519 RepID=UPI003D292C63
MAHRVERTLETKLTSRRTDVKDGRIAPFRMERPATGQSDEAGPSNEAAHPSGKRPSLRPTAASPRSA